MLPCFLLLQSLRSIRARLSRRRLSEYQPTPPMPTTAASPLASAEKAAESAPMVTPQKSCDMMAMKVFIGGKHSPAVSGGQPQQPPYGPGRQKQRTGPRIAADPSLGVSLFAGEPVGLFLFRCDGNAHGLPGVPREIREHGFDQVRNQILKAVRG